MKIQILALVPLFASGPAQAESERPTFGEPVVTKGASCPILFKVVRSPHNQILSILRDPQDSSGARFIAVGKGFNRNAKSACPIEIRIDPQKATQQLSLDLQGGEQKDAETLMSITMRIGSTEHKMDYTRGRWFASMGAEVKRFVVDVKPGTTSVRVVLSGVGKSYDGNALAFYDFESMDLCFVDPARPQDCASMTQTNPSAGDSADR